MLKPPYANKSLKPNHTFRDLRELLAKGEGGASYSSLVETPLKHYQGQACQTFQWGQSSSLPLPDCPQKGFDWHG